jgi:hypothetical protein
MNSQAGRFIAAALVLIAASVPRPAQAGGYTFINFDFPGAAGGTTANAINNTGSIVGFGNDGAGNLTNFIRNPNGTFTLLTPPLGIADMANGINTAKLVVGVTGTNAFSLPFGGSVGLLPAANPGHTGSEAAFGVNDNGLIVGQYADTSTGTTPGFVYNGKAFTILNPVAPVGGVLVVNAQGINNNGLLTGFYTTDNTTPPVDGNEPQHGFFYDTKTNKFTLPTDPSVPNFFTVQLLSVNDHDLAAGYYQDKTGNQHGLLYDFNSGKYLFLDDPAAAVVNGIVTTQITGINDGGILTGFYVGADGIAHGFEGVPEPQSLALLGIGMAMTVVYLRRRQGRASRTRHG